MSIQVKRAKAIAIHRVQDLESEGIRTESALDRALAEEVRAYADVPRFDQSAVDGFAMRSKDLEGVEKQVSIALRIDKSVTAGHSMGEPLRQRMASYVTTGALLPLGADTVIKTENIVRADDQIIVSMKVKKGQNIRTRGLSFKKGKVLLRPNTRLGPQEIGLLISAEVRQVKVFRRPRVAVLVTGDELVAWDKPLPKGKIYNSNSHLLLSLLQRAGCEPIDLGIVGDDLKEIETRLREGLSADAICTSGGQSVGEKDYLKDLSFLPGFERVFWSVKMRPGYYTSLHLACGKPIFGLSGRPSALFVAFEIIFRPALLKMAGFKSKEHPIIEALLCENLQVNPNTVNYREAQIWMQKGIYRTTTKVLAFKSRGEVNGVIEIPEGIDYLKKGSIVKAYLIGNIGGLK